MIITPLVESSADMMYRAAHAGEPEYANTGDNLRGGAHGNDPFRHPTQDLHGDVRANCCAPVVENVGVGGIFLHSRVDLQFGVGKDEGCTGCSLKIEYKGQAYTLSQKTETQFVFCMRTLEWMHPWVHSWMV